MYVLVFKGRVDQVGPSKTMWVISYRRLGLFAEFGILRYILCHFGKDTTFLLEKVGLR